ncbi:hypothetical protein F4776DRAFT_668305 [Hypoxylon sp. NC0597]|nr:hypothetical protein F4776DRAFT_668305 [Hypoxylon sp. NC0597]
MSSPYNMSDSTQTARRPRWKDHEDVIKFILKRTIPDYPVPRGATKDLYHSVAREVKETFNLRGLVDYTGIKYVTEKYGTDPLFGNRKMLVIHPAKTPKGRMDTPRASNATFKKARRAVESGGGQLILCPHCGGHGFLDVREARPQVDPKPREDQSSGFTNIHPTPQVVSNVPYPGPNDIGLGINHSQSFEPSTSAFSRATVPSPAVNMPSIHQSSSHSGYLLPTVPTVPSNGTLYNGIQDTGRRRSQMPQSPGIWTSASNTIGSGRHIGQTPNSSVGDGIQQTVPIPQATPMGPLAGQSATGMAMDATVDSSYWQMDQEAMLNKHQANVPAGQAGTTYQVAQPGQIEPMSRSRRAPELLSLGGHNPIPPAPGAVMHGRPPKRPRTEDQESGNRRESTALHGGLSTGNERASKRLRINTAEQSSMMGIGQDLLTSVGLPSEQQVAANDNSYFLNNDYPIDNAIPSQDFDFSLLDPAIFSTNYSAGGDHGFDQLQALGVAAPAGTSSGVELPATTAPDYDIDQVDFSQFLKDYADAPTFGF